MREISMGIQKCSYRGSKGKGAHASRENYKLKSVDENGLPHIGRPRIHANNAERQKAYRNRKKEKN